MFISQLCEAKRRVGLNTFKKMLLETVFDVYMNAIPVENTEIYQDSLKDTLCEQFELDFGHITTRQELAQTILSNKHVTPFLIEAVLLYESVAEKAESDITVQTDFPEVNVELGEDELNIANEFNKLQGSAEYGKDILEKVVETFKAEKELAEIKKDQTNDMLEQLNGADDKLTESVVYDKLKHMSVMPDTLFQSIIINKSKTILSEATADYNNSKSDIAAEALTTYALFETFNVLGLKHYTADDVEKLKFRFFTE